MTYNPEAAKRYKAKNIKRIPLDVNIEEYARIKIAADAAGEPVNTYIKNAIRQRISKEAKAPINQDNNQ